MSWPTREQYVGEAILWELDVVDRLNGATISSAGTASLTHVNSKQSYPTGISGGSSVSGTKVRQKITALLAGNRYLLIIPFTDSVGNTQIAGLFLECAS